MTRRTPKWLRVRSMSVESPVTTVRAGGGRRHRHGRFLLSAAGKSGRSVPMRIAGPHGLWAGCNGFTDLVTEERWIVFCGFCGGDCRITLALTLATVVAGKLSAAEAAASPGPALTGPAQVLEHPPAADNRAAESLVEMPVAETDGTRGAAVPGYAESPEQPRAAVPRQGCRFAGLAAGNCERGRGPFGAVGASGPAGRSADSARL